MFAVIEHSYKTWYPTFCVMLGYVTKEEGAFNVSMIALFVTAFKFGNFHAVKALNVMTIGDLFLFTSTIFAFFLGYPNYLIYISAVLFAAFNFAQYPFYYALPTYYKYTMSIKNGTTIIMSYAFGETLLVTLSGYLMDFIHPIALHFYILIFVIVTRLLYTNTLKVMEKNRESFM